MNLYEIIPHRILEALETGTVPWRQTWAAGLPKNLGTGREYRGLNLLVLAAAPFTSRYWVSQREVLCRGGQVRNGQRPTAILQWKWRTREELPPGSTPTGGECPDPGRPFAGAVFNLDQIEGISHPDDDRPQQPARRLEVADLLLTVQPNPPRLVHALVPKPAYHRATDTVTLPHLSRFETADAYYANLFYGLVCATSHARRLNRGVETEDYPAERSAFENLVAELGAAFLCGFARLSNASTGTPQARDLKEWSDTLRRDPTWLVWAALAAQDAADYLRGKRPAAEPQPLVQPQRVSVQVQPTVAARGGGPRAFKKEIRHAKLVLQ